MQDLSLHILDLAENAIRAGAHCVDIRLEQDTRADKLRLTLRDDGHGMPESWRREVLSPFATTRQERDVGLGLALLAQAAHEVGGTCLVESAPGQGTLVCAEFSLTHIDRKPIGDILQTFRTLAHGSPGVDFVLTLVEDGEEQCLDTRTLRGAARVGNSTAAGPGTAARPPKEQGE